MTKDFASLNLSLDDYLPADIELVIGYRSGVTQDVYQAALQQGLHTFSHLTGKLERMRIVPSEREFKLEIYESPREISIRNLEEMPLVDQSTTFIPQAQSDSVFSARLTRFKNANLSVLGIRVSHAAVDGTGLALFISHCTASLRGMVAPPVFHDRRCRLGTIADGSDEVPQGYREFDGSEEAENLAGCTPTLFAISLDTVLKCFNAVSLRDARFQLAGWLCAGMEPFSEMALWCDPRGLNGIPATYTGNLGCYLHFSLHEKTAEELAKSLKSTATRMGFQRISETHRRIKLAEAQGRPLIWDGLKKRVLQLNLVPHAVEGTDFGGGLPEYAILLSRNSSGLRISVTPDATRFLIEACLHHDLGEKLFQKCRAAGLEPLRWCQGESQCK